LLAGFTFLQKKRSEKKERKYRIHKLFRAREEEGEFHTLLGRPKDERQKFSNILE
jgi:hypothetical protein